MIRKKKSDLHLKINPLDDIDNFVVPQTPLTTPQIIVQSPSSNHLPFADAEDDEEVISVVISDTKPHVNGGIQFAANDGDSDYKYEVPCVFVSDNKPRRNRGIHFTENDGLLQDEELDLSLIHPPESEDEERKRSLGLRRNSVSLPAGINKLDIEMLRQQHRNHPANIPEHNQGSGSTTYSEDNDGSLEGLNEILAEEHCVKIPLRRNVRRKSVMMPPVKSPDGDSSTIDSSDDDSPVNSITSINSLASLLKEKIQSIPSKIKKKPTDYKIRAFVGFLFLCIVFFVGFAYIMYHQQVLAGAYFEKLKFSKGNRQIKVFNKEGAEIMNGELGIYLGKSKAYDCLTDADSEPGSICLQWLNGARLYFNKVPITDDTETDIRCYTIKWQALLDGVHPTDCYDWSSTQDHWYGGGQFANMSWPLETSTHDFAPFVTGDIKKHQWGNALMRYFINSRGAVIIIDNDTPLYVSINHENSKKFCIQARHDDFAYVNHLTKFPELKYKICTSSNMKTLHSSLSQQSLWDGLKQEDISILDSLISEPIWHIAPRLKHELTEALIYNYTEDVIALGFLKQGHVLINEYWQDNIGDFTLDTTRFPTLEETVNIIHRRGFKIVFSIQPFISTESPNFAECIKKRLLISERFSDRRIPALTRYKSLNSAGVLDITNNRSIPWLHEKLKKVLNTYKVDAFFLDMGTAHNMPHYYQCERRLSNPDQYKTFFTDSFEKSISLIGVTSAVSLPRPPIFVSLPPFESTWEAIKNVIPTILSYGIIGYPFLMPGAVGGDIDWPGGEQFVPGSPKTQFELNNVNETEIVLPEKELYLRWLQLATFLPVMKFTHLPSKYNDEQVLETAKILTILRQKTVTPLLMKYSQEALDQGLALIRPLWMLEPHDPACHTVDDEFSVGEELIVAPVLEKGVTHREVYLPSGVWKDGIDGSLRKGSRWIHDYRVPTDKVAYFVKMPDNTRF